jgi:2-polyprenyl-6-methoxyphenol hydroxylase-like FAD-dependent oxidoreductase
MACASSALMIGGGIAGLSAAIALSRIGVKCDVVEIAHEPMGASLGISGRAAEALDELGVYDECYATGTPWERDSTVATLMDSAGNVISAMPPRPDWPGSKTAIGVYRPTLLKIMADEALRLGVRIERGLTAIAVEDQKDAAVVTLSSGEVRRYDFVVGTDGIGSRTRAMLFPEAPKPEYAGQMSMRWMAPGPAIQPEGWYAGPVGRIGFYYLPQGYVYVAAVISAKEWVRMTKEEVFALFTRLLASYTAPAIVELRNRLTPDSDLICRPFEWIMLPDPWFTGRALLIGDAAHATTAHLGMGGGMALEDAVVLAQCIEKASTLQDAFEAFMVRRLQRVRTVVETSVALSRLEQAKAPPSENRALMKTAFETISQPY